MNDPFWKIVAIATIGLLVAIVVLLILVLRRRRTHEALVGVPAVSAGSQLVPQYSGEATLTALQMIGEVDATFIEAVNIGSTESMEQNVVQHRQLAQACNGFAAKLGFFADADVDPKAVALFRPFAELYRQYAELCSDFSAYFERIIECDSRNIGIGVFIEGAIRGALGDPFGKRREVQAEHRELDSESDELQKRLDTLLGVRNGLLESLNTTVARLAVKYEWEMEKDSAHS